MELTLANRQKGIYEIALSSLTKEKRVTLKESSFSLSLTFPVPHPPALSSGHSCIMKKFLWLQKKPVSMRNMTSQKNCKMPIQYADMVKLRNDHQDCLPPGFVSGKHVSFGLIHYW